MKISTRSSVIRHRGHVSPGRHAPRHPLGQVCATHCTRPAPPTASSSAMPAMCAATGPRKVQTKRFARATQIVCTILRRITGGTASAAGGSGVAVAAPSRAGSRACSNPRRRSRAPVRSNSVFRGRTTPGEAERTGIPSEEDVVHLVKEVRHRQ